MGVMDAILAANDLRAVGIAELELHPDGTIKRIVLGEKPEPVVEPATFGIPEALQKAKDDEAQRLRDEADAKWADEQQRYAHTEGYVEP